MCGLEGNARQPGCLTEVVVDGWANGRVQGAKYGRWASEGGVGVDPGEGRRQSHGRGRSWAVWWQARACAHEAESTETVRHGRVQWAGTRGAHLVAVEAGPSNQRRMLIR